MANRFTIEAVYKAIDQMTRPIQKMTVQNKKFMKSLKTDFSSAQRSVSKFGDNFKTALGTGLRTAAIVGVGGATLALKSFLNEAQKIENAVAAFTPLLGGAEKANKLVDMLNQTAATTPFQFETIAKTANQVLPFMEGNLDKTIKTFRLLGDTAGGNMQKLDSITRGYSKSLAKGKVDMEALNMISEAGVPIISELAKKFGVSTEKIFEMSSKGKILSKDLTETFEQMTTEGGIFFQGMEIASKTLTGKISTLKDVIALTFAEIGGNLLPIVKPLIDRLIELGNIVRNYVKENKELINQRIQETFKIIVDVLKVTIKVASKIVTIFVKFFKHIKPLLPLILGIVIAWQVYQKTLLIVAAAQAILNAVMTANPIGIMITAIGLLIGGIIILIKNWDKVSVNIRKGVEKAKLFLQSMGIDINKLFNIIKNGVMIIASPFVFLIKTIKNVIDKWDGIKKAFSEKGPIEGLKELGKSILEGMVNPFLEFAETTKKLPTIIKIIASPLLLIINIIRSIIQHWDIIKNEFKEGGILKGILAIGKAILDAILEPIQKFLELVSKIPGVGKLAAGGAEKIEELRKNLFLASRQTEKTQRPIERIEFPKIPDFPKTETTEPETPMTPMERSLLKEESIQRSEVVIRDETGKAEMKKQPQKSNIDLKLSRSAEF